MFDMWVLIYLLICLLPVALILLVFAAIAGAGMRVYRTVMRSLKELKPYTDGIAADVKRAQDRGASFAERGQKVAETFAEISGRWAFVTEAFSEASQSPVTKLAGLIGRVKKGA